MDPSFTLASTSVVGTLSTHQEEELVDLPAPQYIGPKPAWGVLYIDGPQELDATITLYADKPSYSVGLSSEHDIRLPYKWFPRLKSDDIGTFIWTGLGIPGYEKEANDFSEIGVEDTKLDFFYVDQGWSGDRWSLKYNDEITFSSDDPVDVDADLCFRFLRPRHQIPRSKANEAFEHQYELLECLGVGDHGIVHKALHRQSEGVVAVKSMKKKKILGADWQLADVKREFSLMEAIAPHRNILRFQEMFICDSGPKFVMELVDGLSLHTHILNSKGLAESETRYLLAQICDGVAYMHRLGIVHRNLNAGNILVANDGQKTIKIKDFGVAKLTQQLSKMTTIYHTKGYPAPEFSGSVWYTTEVDCWHIGITMFNMYTDLKIEFDFMLRGPSTQDQQEIDSRPLDLRLANMRQPGREPFSELGCQFLGGLMKPRPGERMSMEDALKHPWLAVSEPIKMSGCQPPAQRGHTSQASRGIRSIDKVALNSSPQVERTPMLSSSQEVWHAAFPGNVGSELEVDNSLPPRSLGGTQETISESQDTIMFESQDDIDIPLLLQSNDASSTTTINANPIPPGTSGRPARSVETRDILLHESVILPAILPSTLVSNTVGIFSPGLSSHQEPSLFSDRAGDLVTSAKRTFSDAALEDPAPAGRGTHSPVSSQADANHLGSATRRVNLPPSTRIPVLQTASKVIDAHEDSMGAPPLSKRIRRE